ncbi:MAG TPA: ABC transporter permease [Kofleriaceae bacterium]|nr:ABC transporter permease [Kofleriaceae bacterium]
MSPSRWPAFALAQLARVVAVVLAVAIGCWLLAEAAPGDATERAARAGGVMPPDDAPIPDQLRRSLMHEIAREHGTDRGMSARLGSYLAGLARLELGRSWHDRGAVSARLGPPARRTLGLVLGALLVSLLVGVGAAYASARAPGARTDWLLGGLAAIAVAVPPVWLALILLRVFAAGEPWSVAPIGGTGSIGALVLPLFTLALVPAFVIARHVRAALVTARVQPYVVAARARGASEARALVRHALRCEAGALLPLVTALTAYLLGAAVVIEEVFGIDGLGRVLAAAAGHGDAPVVVGVCVVMALVVAVTASAVDTARRVIDPRPRARGGGDAS